MVAGSGATGWCKFLPDWPRLKKLYILFRPPKKYYKGAVWVRQQPEKYLPGAPAVESKVVPRAEIGRLVSLIA